MIKLLTLSIALVLAQNIFAQCSEEEIAKLPFDCAQYTKTSKFYGKNEIKANTELFYPKLLTISKMLTDAFKNTKGMYAQWEAQVNDLNKEGNYTGWVKFYMQPVECKTDGGFNKKTGNSTLDFTIYINSFHPRLILDTDKESFGYATKNKNDYVDGHLIYLIAEKQWDEPFKGFPMYYKDWNNQSQNAVLITKPEIPLFKPISIAQFLELLRKWTNEYNAGKKEDKYLITGNQIDKFISSNSKEYLAQPCITNWDRSEQIVYIKKSTYLSDPTMGNPWVFINPDYSKDSNSTALQYVMITWNGGNTDALTKQALKDFKTNFDFKKLQSMLEK